MGRPHLEGGLFSQAAAEAEATQEDVAADGDGETLLRIA